SELKLSLLSLFFRQALQIYLAKVVDRFSIVFISKVKIPQLIISEECFRVTFMLMNEIFNKFFAISMVEPQGTIRYIIFGFCGFQLVQVLFFQVLLKNMSCGSVFFLVQ